MCFPPFVFCILQRNSGYYPVSAYHWLVQLLCLQTVCDCPVHGFHAAPHSLPLCSLVCSICSAHYFLKLVLCIHSSVVYFIIYIYFFTHMLPGDVLLIFGSLCKI